MGPKSSTSARRRRPHERESRAGSAGVSAADSARRAQKRARVALERARIARMRVQMDALNLRLLAELERRVEFARRIGRAKQRLGIDAADPARERAMLAALVSCARGTVPRRDVERIFRAVFRASRAAVLADRRAR